MMVGSTVIHFMLSGMVIGVGAMWDDTTPFCKIFVRLRCVGYPNFQSMF